MFFSFQRGIEEKCVFQTTMRALVIHFEGVEWCSVVGGISKLSACWDSLVRGILAPGVMAEALLHA